MTLNTGGCLRHSGANDSLAGLQEEILGFIGRTTGLRGQVSGDYLEITQVSHNKKLTMNRGELSDVLKRVDMDGRDFLQVNFVDGRKLLLTDTLVGFKPFESIGLDMTKIPKVVTTPDLLSVLEAIEETMSLEPTHESEVDVLKKVYMSILLGGELIGFDLIEERRWIDRLMPSSVRASA